MPDAVGSGLMGWLRRGNGIALLGFAAIGWLGLLSWEMPARVAVAAHASALTHLVGHLPSAAADFLLQSFGIAAAFVFAVPTFWGIEQIARQRLGRPFLRLVLWPASVLAAAGALSTLPTPANWPFARGLGGVVGDQLFALAKLAIPVGGPTVVTMLAGVAFGVAALVLFGTAVGAFGASPSNSGPADAAASGFRDISLGDENREVQSVPAADAANTDFELAVESPAAAAGPALRMAPPRKGHAPAFTRLTDEPVYGQTSDRASADPRRPMHVPYDDLPDDDESRRMAKRFAPAGERPDSVDSEPVGEPAPWIGWKQLLGRATDVVAPIAASAPVQQVAWQTAAIAETDAALPAEQSYTAEYAAPELATASVRTWAEPAMAYKVPSVNLLSRLPSQSAARASDNLELVARARKLEDVLSQFGVRCQIVSVVPGPIVTQFEIETAPGIKSTRVVGLADDIARSLGAGSARITPIPGRATLSIELPNERRGEVALRDLLVSRPYRQAFHALPVAIGVAVDDKPIIADLAMMPGLLVAGRAGAGKSTLLNAILASLLFKFAPADLRLLIIDPKGIDHAPLDGIAHLVAPVIRQPAQALAALDWCVVEMDERLKAMAKLNLRGIGTYNNAVRNALRQGTGFKRSVQTGFDRATGRAIYEEEIVTPKAMPAIVVVIDDIDVVIQTGGDGVPAALQRLGRSANDAGIYIVAATGRLDGDSLPAAVRNALPARMTFKLDSKAESRSILADGGADQLLSAGDFLFSIGGTPVRGQAPVLADGDLGKLCEAIRRQASTAYEPALMAAAAPKVQQQAPDDSEIYQQAISLALQHGATSIAELRGRLGVGYVAANDLLLRMQAAGLVGGEDDQSGRRRVLLGRAASA